MYEDTYTQKKNGGKELEILNTVGVKRDSKICCPYGQTFI